MSGGTALVLKGHLAIGPVGEAPTDVSDVVTRFVVKGTRDIVDIAATLASPKSSRAGGVKYELEVGYFSDPDSNSLFSMFWDALATADGQLYFEGAMSDDTIASENPMYSGIFVVTSAAVGGEAEGLSTDSGTFPMVGGVTRDGTT